MPRISDIILTMQAIILAGGYGTRLYPLTIDAPKPMIHVGGKPMIEYLIEKLENLGNFTEIFIVTNAKFSHVFEEWLKNKAKNIPITIINDGTTNNEDRLGALGDIQYVLDNHKITDDVIILAGDNFFEDDLTSIVANFKTKGDTVGLVDVGDRELVKQYGNVGIDEEGKITSFIEKPENPIGTLCSTAIYIYKNTTLSHVKELVE